MLKNIDELKLLVDEEDLTILAINEIKLNNETSNEIISLDNFDLRRKDRNRHGGRVAIYINYGGRVAIYTTFVSTIVSLNVYI